MKKVLAVLLVMVLTMGLVTACGKKEEVKTDTTTKEVETKEDAKEEVKEEVKAEEPAMDLTGKTVKVGRWGGNDAETAAFNKMVADFTAATGVKVEERIYSDYNQELQAELIGGTAPDVFYVDAYMAPFYISQEVLLELDATEFSLDEFYQPLKDAFMKDGKYYAVSKDYSTLALYYNKKYINEADIPKTFEDLMGSDYLVNLQKTLPEGMVAMTYNQDLARDMFLAQAGGVSVTRDDIYSNLGASAIVSNLSIELNAAKEGKIKTPADLGLGWNGDAFGNEKTAIMIEGNWSLGFLKDNFPNVEFGIIEIPTYKGEKGTMVFTVGYSINAMSTEVDAAKAFIQYATGTEGMATWTTGAGVLPSRKDVTDSTNVATDPLKIPHIAGAAYATAWQKGTTMDTINNEFKNFIPSFINGERTLEEALKVAEEEANKTIEANQ